ncbi:MAG TPA: LLM class flavin-dependent oxidoreductase [Methylomirabilota bacterium]|nr:LLM class flavin-dependent oxidoreductase [Methylomirabilota bacterium]
MRLGVTLPTASPDGSPLTAEALVGGARRAEQAGFDSLWFFDAIGRGFILPDPLIGASVAATVTTRPEIGTCVLQVPLRNPVELAHRILTAHLLSRGRLLLGVGAGSTQADFDALGLDFTARMRTLEDALPVMRRLWRGEKVGLASLEPWPAAVGGPRVLIGSWSGQRWIPRAAQEYDGWIASAAKTSLDTLAEGIKRYRAAGGKRAIVTNIRTDLSAPTEPCEDSAPFHLGCAPAEAAGRLGRLRDLGFDDAVLVLKAPTEANLGAARALLRA